MKISVGIVSALIAVALTGCASNSPSTSEPFVAKPLPVDTPKSTSAATDNPTLRSTIPSPNAEQQKSLIDELSKINPALINEKTVANARNQCSSLYPEMSPNAVKNAQLRFTKYWKSKGYQVTEEDGKAINDVILANGFCRNP